MHNKKNERKTQTVFFLLAVCMVLAVAAYSSIVVWQSRQELSQFKKQLPQQIKNLVQQEVRVQLTMASADNNAVKQMAAAPDLLDETIRKAVKDELDLYVGGTLPHKVSAGNLQKPFQETNNMVSDTQPLQYAANTTEPIEIPAGGTGGSNASESGSGPKKDKAIQRTLVQKGGMLLPKGQFQIEPGITMAHFSSNKINIQGFSILPVLVIGDISVQSVKRDMFIPSLTFRYSPIYNLQTEVNIPYRYEFNRLPDNVGGEDSKEAGGLGDIQVTLSRQIAYESGAMPDLLASLTVKSITGEPQYKREIGLGTGHWGIRGALIAAKSSDPAVVFGNINYTLNLAKEYADYGKIKPGDSIGYALGAAIALSYQTAINFQFEQNLTFKMEKDGTSVNGSFLNAASLKTGFTWSISDKCSIDFSVGMGLTSDAPDYTVELRVPVRF